MKVLQNTVARPVGGVSFGPGGRTLVAGGSGGYDVWDLATETHTTIPSHAVKYLCGCVYDPLGRWVYVADYLGGSRRLALDGGGSLPAPGPPHERHVIAFSLTPDGSRLVMSRGGAGTNRVECWEASSSGPFVPVWAVRDGEPIDPHEPFRLNQATGFANGVAVEPGGGSVAAAERLPDGSDAAAGGIVIRDGGTGRVAAELAGSAASPSRLAFAPDGRTLFAWDVRTLERWGLTAGRRTGRVLAPARSYSRRMAVHPPGRVVITASGGGQARYWNPEGLSPVRVFRWWVGGLHSIAVSPDGTMAAAGGDKGRVVIWDVDE